MKNGLTRGKNRVLFPLSRSLSSDGRKFVLSTSNPQVVKDADDAANAQSQREEREEHHEARQRVQDVEEGGWLPRESRTHRVVRLRRRRVRRLPNRSVHLDGNQLDEQLTNRIDTRYLL